MEQFPYMIMNKVTCFLHFTSSEFPTLPRCAVSIGDQALIASLILMHLYPSPETRMGDCEIFIVTSNCFSLGTHLKTLFHTAL